MHFDLPLQRPHNFLSERRRKEMASTSALRGNSNAGRIANATTTFYPDNQAFIAEIRKSLAFFKAIAVDMEKDNQFEKVKELEEAVLELLSTWDDCMHFSMALESIGNSYQPKDELTDFKKLLEDEVVKIKRDSPSVPQKNPFFRQFKEAIWVLQPQFNCKLNSLLKCMLLPVKFVHYKVRTKSVPY